MNRTPQELLDFRGKTVLVTGSGSGLGRGIALRFAEAGARVAVHYQHSAEGAHEVVCQVEELGGKAASFQADLTCPDEAGHLMDETVKGLGGLDVLVNNAGIYPVETLLEMEFKNWQKVLDANLNSAFLAGQAAARVMVREGRGGAIVNIASIEALNPTSGHAHYCTAKAGVVMLTRSMAKEFGPHGIRVNAVLPGLIWKEGIEQSWPEGVERWLKAVPLGRLGQPEDVADACLFLASEGARWISGAELLVDGGIMTGQVY